MKAVDVVQAAVVTAPDALFVSSLGTATSALRLASDDAGHLYLGGAMGCGLAVALGVAERLPERRVIAIVGDGDLLMGSGSLWSLSGLCPTNLLVVVLADGSYAITGGQVLVMDSPFARIGGALNHITAVEAASPSEVSDAVASLPRPGLVLAQIAEREWPGPSAFVDPPMVRARFAAGAAGVETE